MEGGRKSQLSVSDRESHRLRGDGGWHGRGLGDVNENEFADSDETTNIDKLTGGNAVQSRDCMKLGDCRDDGGDTFNCSGTPQSGQWLRLQGCSLFQWLLLCLGMFPLCRWI